MSKEKVSRRDFLKKTGSGATATAVTLAAVRGSKAGPVAELDVDRGAVVAAIGDTLIPSDPGDPGYRILEPYNITAEVLKELRVNDEELALFGSYAGEMFSGRGFLELSESEREKYFDAIFSGEQIADKETAETLRRVLQSVRRRVFQVYYSNYPEHALPRDAAGVPILPPGDSHQITNPNTRGLTTGWDIGGFMGPLSWEEEERRRKIVGKIDWKE
ncbi:twin-arginine translocation signal domain-containing protein [Acidobacteria bacterium AH-259-D05]|nr:twin-arginine translocation signal domain-containing protein [Acidobacteria bacterium AH-259-D05]